MKASRSQRIATLLAFGCLIAGGRFGVAVAATAIDSPVWVVDPGVAGDNRPPAGRSEFDRLFASVRNGRLSYDIPYPFDALLARIDARLEHDAANPLPPAKRVLIPLGRSLQRTVAAPDYFAFPRVVVAVDSPPGTATDPLLKDRLYIGYQEQSATLEVISYNEEAGRFEFQLVRNYRAGATPAVSYANRTLCFACHQNGAPIFSRALWDETNANPRIASLLTAEGRSFYGIPPTRGVDVPYAIDNAVRRANNLALSQRLWQEGCGTDDTAAQQCRAGLFLAALRHALADGRRGTHIPTAADPVGRAAATLRANAGRRWPGGLALGVADLPNRNPLPDSTPWPADPERRQAIAHVAARFDPLAPRPPRDIWRADAVDAVDRAIGGLAEFVASPDRHRLAAALAARPAPVVEYRAPCRFTPPASRGAVREAARWSIKCRPAAGENGPRLSATVDATPRNTSVGHLQSLILPDSGSLNGVALTAAAPRSGERFAFAASNASPGDTPRDADGNPLTRIAFALSPEDPTAGAVLVELRDEFPVVERAVADLAAGEDAPTLFAARPFPRAALFAALFERLGAAPVSNAPQTPLPHIDEPANGSANVAANVPLAVPDTAEFATSATPAERFYPYCATCHRTGDAFPPNFLQGSAAQVVANLRQCAPRLFVRLATVDLPPDRRDKTPMPPESTLTAFGTDIAGWRASAARAALLAEVGGWLRAETGQPPDLTHLLADGYEALRPCLPGP